MTTFEKNVKSICDEVYNKFPEQILIDFIQDTVEDLLNKDNSDPLRRDDVGAASSQCRILLEVYNPKLEWDINVLTRLKKALDEWEKDIERTNIMLGIPRET